MTKAIKKILILILVLYICISPLTQTTRGIGTVAAATNSLDNFLFIGDSRTRGAKSQLEKLGTGITVIGVDSSTPSQWINVATNGSGTVRGKSVTLPESSKVKGISVALGVNGITEIDSMKTLLDKLLERYPSSTIYVNEVFKVGKDYKYGDISASDFNSSITTFNNSIKSYCQGKNRLEYVGVSSGLYDAQGYLDSKYTDDSLHLNADGYEKLAQNIKQSETGSTGTSEKVGITIERVHTQAESEETGFEFYVHVGNVTYTHYYQLRGFYKNDLLIHCGRDYTISYGGCGYSSCANVLSGYGVNVTPRDTVIKMNRQFYSNAQIQTCMEAYGVSGQWIAGQTKQGYIELLEKALSEGKPAIALLDKDVGRR